MPPSPQEAAPKHSPGAEKTRQALLEAAMVEFREVGYRGASLRCILKRAGVTKGALYHHFTNKQALGYAVVDEIIGAPLLEAARLLEQSQDPIGAMQEILRQQILEPPEDHLRRGCPFQLLAQEMAPQDEGFRLRIQGMFRHFHEATRRALQRAQEQGRLRPDVEVSGAAALLIATRNGLMGMARHCPDRELVLQATDAFLQQLEAMRASAPPAKEHL